MFKKGRERVGKEMEITSIIKKLRNFNHFYKNIAVDEQTKLEIKL
jgi:hypothetical protein